MRLKSAIRISILSAVVAFNAQAFSQINNWAGKLPSKPLMPFEITDIVKVDGKDKVVKVFWEEQASGLSNVKYEICKHSSNATNSCEKLNEVIDTNEAEIPIEQLFAIFHTNYFVRASANGNSIDSPLVQLEKEVAESLVTPLIGAPPPVGSKARGILNYDIKLNTDGTKFAIAGEQDGKLALIIGDIEDGYVVSTSTITGFYDGNPEFGHNTSMGFNINSSGDKAVVSAFTDGDTGTAWLYHRNASSGEWDKIKEFKSSEPRNRGSFGYSVDLSDDGKIIAIGEPGIQSGGGSGKVYIFTEDGDWNETIIEDAEQCNYFGMDVLLSNDGKVLSTLDYGSSSCIKVKIFRNNEEGWTDEFTLASGRSIPNFSVNMALSGDGTTFSYIPVIVSQLDLEEDEAPVSYTYNEETKTWSVDTFKLTEDTAGNSNIFFYADSSLSEDGNKIFVSNWSDDVCGKGINKVGRSPFGDCENFIAPLDGAGSGMVLEKKNVNGKNTWEVLSHITSNNPVTRGAWGALGAMSGDGKKIIVSEGSDFFVY